MFLSLSQWCGGPLDVDRVPLAAGRHGEHQCAATRALARIGRSQSGLVWRWRGPGVQGGAACGTWNAHEPRGLDVLVAGSLWERLKVLLFVCFFSIWVKMVWMIINFFSTTFQLSFKRPCPWQRAPFRPLSWPLNCWLRLVISLLQRGLPLSCHFSSLIKSVTQLFVCLWFDVFVLKSPTFSPILTSPFLFLF